MFSIAKILDPIQSTIVLFMSLFPRGRKSAAPHHRRSRTVRNGNSAHTTGAKPQARKVLHRRQTRGIISTSRSSSGSSTKSWGVRDTEYYYHSALNDESCCILKAENTLFKVHTLVLCRDGSAFEKRLWFQRPDIRMGSSDARPLIIQAPAEKFRDLLWVLHAFPPDFYLNPEDESQDDSLTDCYVDFHSLSLHRLLNIAEMAHKYSFPSFEHWAIHQICRILKCTTPRRPGKVGSSSASSSATLISTSGGNKPHPDLSELEEPLDTLDETDGMYSRLLLIALTCNHSSLLQYLVQKLVTKILWFNHVPGVSLVLMLERHRHHPALATLLGVVYYRILIDMPQTSHTNAPRNHYSPYPQPIFPPTINVERRMQFLAAHHRLTRTWNDICCSPPELQSSRRFNPSNLKALRSHTSCSESWRCLWRTACYQAQSRMFSKNGSTIKHLPNADTGRGGSSADVLGLLKMTMLQLRKLTAGTSSICIECSLEGLEAVDLLRDQLIEGLIHMFGYEQ